MEQKEFIKIMKDNLNTINVNLSDAQIMQFYKYMNLLIEWNTVMNLTAITDAKEIITKHFIDSLTILKHIEDNSKIIDVGTGAGFPGIPIKIAYPNTKVILLDSLNKRIKFLNETIKKLELHEIEAIHGRAEEYGRNKDYRESFDIAVARAVAPLNVLIEYLIPFVKINGKCLCMKGANSQEEIEKSIKAIDLLGGEFKETEEFTLLNTDMKRRIIEVQKKSHTENKYPRKAGIPSKKPL